MFAEIKRIVDEDINCSKESGSSDAINFIGAIKYIQSTVSKP